MLMGVVSSEAPEEIDESPVTRLLTYQDSVSALCLIEQQPIEELTH